MSDNNNLEIFGNVNEVLEYCQFITKDTWEKETNGEEKLDYNTVQGKLLTALLKPIAQTFFIMQDLAIKQLIPQAFPNTANSQYLQQYWGSIFNMYILDASDSKGYIIVQGTEGASVDAGTIFYNGSNNYKSQQLVYIRSYTLPTDSIEERDRQIIIRMKQDFLLADGIIMKSMRGGYNADDKKIKALSTDTFSFEKVEGEEITSQEGQVTFVLAQVYVTSETAGVDTILNNGTEVKLLNPVSNINETNYVSYDGVVGGKNAQTLEEYRQNILSIFQNMPQGWTEAGIIYYITRYDNYKYSDAYIFIPRAENPEGETVPGHTTIYLLKSDLSFFSKTEKDKIKDFLKETIYPAKDTLDIFNIVDPVLKKVEINVKITNPNKNTLDMQDAIRDQAPLIQYDDSICWFRQGITLKTITDFIGLTIDKNGIILEGDYEIVTPTENVELAYNEFPLISINVVE